MRQPRLTPDQRRRLEEAESRGFLPAEDASGWVARAWRVRCWLAGLPCSVVEGPGPEVRLFFWLPPGRRLTREAPWAFMADSGGTGRVVGSYSPFFLSLQTRIEVVPETLTDLARLVEDCASPEGRASLRRRASALGRADDDTRGVRESLYVRRDPSGTRPVEAGEFPLFAAALEGVFGAGASGEVPVLAGLHWLRGALDDPWAWVQTAGLLPFLRHLAAGRSWWRMDPGAAGLRVVEEPAAGPGPAAVSFSASGYRPGMRRALLEMHRHPDGDFLNERNEGGSTDRFPEILVLSRRQEGWRVLERQVWIPRHLD